MKLSKSLIALLMALGAVGCGPEVSFDESPEAAYADSFDEVQPVDDSALASIEALEPLDVASPIQGRGTFTVCEHTPLEHDLTAVVWAAEPLVVVAMDVEPSDGDFEDVTTADSPTRMLRRRLGESERAVHSDVVGRDMWLYDATGYVCTATLADLWRVREEWAEPHDGGDVEMTGPSREMVAAKVLPLQGDCSGAIYASPAQGKAAFFSEMAEPSAQLSAAAMVAFTKLPEHGEIQKEYESDDWRSEPAQGSSVSAARGSWTAHMDSGSHVTQYSDESGRVLVRVAAWAGIGCGDFRGDLWAVWEQTPTGLSLRAASRGEDGASFIFERDGRLSYGSESQLNVAAGNHWMQSFSVLEPWSCPC